MKIKVRTSLTSTIEVLREEVELSNTRAYCFRYAHSQDTESHLDKKLPQAKIPIAFLFSKLHFNNVTEMLFFLLRPSSYTQFHPKFPNRKFWLWRTS